jgi:outer membrane protein
VNTRGLIPLGATAAMQALRQCLAVGLCAIAALPPSLAQQPQPIPGPAAPPSASIDQNLIEPVRPTGSIFIRPYEAATVPPVRLRNSTRLASLERAGKLYLTAQDAIALALENNIDIEIARYSPISAQWRVTRAEAGGSLPGVPSSASQAFSVASGQGVLGSQAAAGVSGGGGGSISTTSGGNAQISQIGPVTQNLDPSITETTTFSHRTIPQPNNVQSGVPTLVQGQRTISASLQQGLLSGGALSLTPRNSYLNENAPSDFLNPTDASSLALSFQHNLLRGFGRAVNARNITIARLSLGITDLSFKNQVIGLVARVLNAYFALVADYENLRSKQTAVDVANTLLRDSKRKVELGSLAENDLTTAESQLATVQLDLVSAQTVLRQQEVQLKNLLSRNGIADPVLAHAQIVPLDRLDMPVADNLPPLQEMLASALANRPDLAIEQANLKNSEISALGTANGVLPSLAVFAGTSNAGLAGSRNSPLADPYFIGASGTAFGQAFRRNFPSENIGVFTSVSLGNRQAQADAAIDRLQFRQSQLTATKDRNQAQVDVMNAVVAIQQARVRYEAALKNRELAQQLLDAERKKLEMGASVPYNVILQQRDLLTAQASVVSALVTYANARISMDQTLGRTLESNNVSIADARSGRVARESALPVALPDRP